MSTHPAMGLLPAGRRQQHRFPSSLPFMNRLPLVLAAGLMALAAACTSTEPTTTGTPPLGATNDVTNVWHEFVACARNNGQTQWPDAVINDQGQATFPNFDSKTGYSRVEQACGRILDRLPPQTNPFDEQLTPSQVEAMRRYVQCLHQNGMPDVPEPDANGRFTEPPKYREAAYQDVRNAARTACDQILLDAK